MKAITLMIAVTIATAASVSHASVSTAAPICNQKIAGRMMDKTASDYKMAKNTSSSGSTKTKAVKGIRGS
ncbi:hypothetical protein DOM22_00605 [Bdellovibrio sp. ZAP7]|uniref:hypothetical protein n=1 Tax=Bdellovibrio sp. ZAP7 TaxID=2231053 RepID=UPI00115BCBC4|nr:hypothetical protein [Bdellovibrio sp. ZAP7]QDK43769.1 hypothetical protein DOM22_00605 [Bdellovibrio sp. ZAP7]